MYVGRVVTDNDDLEIDIDFEEGAEEELEVEEHTEIVNVSGLNFAALDEAEFTPEIQEMDVAEDRTLGADLTEDLISNEEEAEVFGDYVLLGRVGGNEFVEVWVAGDKTRGQTCVIKRVPRPSEARTEVANISEEIRVTEALSHPNIVETIEGGIIDGIPYISMELVDGMSLTELSGVIGHSHHPQGAVLDLGIQIAEALSYVHTVKNQEGVFLNLIHGNLRPQNIFVTREGFTKLGEVSIAFPVASAEVERKLNIPYLSPEQFGRHPITPQSDLYALGLILIELISGKPLTPFGSLALHNPNAWGNDLVVELPDEIHTYFSSLIAKSALDRPSDAAQVARDLRLLFQRHGQGIGLASYLQDSVFSNVPKIDSVSEDVSLAPIRNDSPIPGQLAPVELPLDALEEVSYPSTVSLIIDDIDWNDTNGEPIEGSIKVLNPGISEAVELDVVPPLYDEASSTFDNRPPRTLRLGPVGRRIISDDPAFRRAVGLDSSQATSDPKEWDYYFIGGDELGPRVIQKSLTSARPYQDQKVIFLKDSELISAFDIEEDAHLLDHGSVWTGDESGYGETRSSSQDPSYLRYHERVMVSSAPRRSTSVRGKVLRFLGK